MKLFVPKSTTKKPESEESVEQEGREWRSIGTKSKRSGVIGSENPVQHIVSNPSPPSAFDVILSFAVIYTFVDDKIPFKRTYAERQMYLRNTHLTSLSSRLPP